MFNSNVDSIIDTFYYIKYSQIDEANSIPNLKMKILINHNDEI